MPSGAKYDKVSKKKRKNLAVLGERRDWNVSFIQQTSNVETVALTRAPENVVENHDISFEAPFTLRLAGHIDMFFFRYFCL